MCLISALYGSFFCEFEWRKCLQAYSSRRLDNLFWQENEGFLLWGYQSVTDICYNRKLIRFFFVSSTYQLAALTFHNVTRLGMSCWYYYGSWMITNALSFPLLFGLLCTVLLYNSDCLSVYLPIYLSIYPSLHPSIYLYIWIFQALIGCMVLVNTSSPIVCLSTNMIFHVVFV